MSVVQQQQQKSHTHTHKIKSLNSFERAHSLCVLLTILEPTGTLTGKLNV